MFQGPSNRRFLFYSTFADVKHLVIFLTVILFFTSWQHRPFKEFHIAGPAQGTVYRITYYAQDNLVTQAQVDSIFNSLDSSLSLYKPYSQVNAFNNSDTGVRTDIHLREVVRKAQEMYTATVGAFDITVWPLVNAWGFGVQKITDVPDAAAIAAIMPCVGAGKLKWSAEVLKKQLPCVQLDVNGIAQGYSVDVLARFLESKTIMNYMIELGGEIRVNGRKQPGNTAMKIGIESPGNHPFSPSLVKKVLSLNSGAVTTSGSYRRFYESNGRRITHIIDPRTGASIQNNLISVTVLAEDAITADALDNALMVMGLEKGLRFAEASGKIEAYFIYRTSRGSIADTATAGFYSFIER